MSSKNITILSSSINGSVVAPASKSYSQRACAAALLKNGTTIITNYGSSNDEKIALEIIQQLGATVVVNKSIIQIESTFDKVDNHLKNINIQVEESGLCLRLFTPICALLNLPITIDGKGSLLKRPIELFIDILPKLNVIIKSKNGKLPLNVFGNMQLKNIAIDGSLSSQFLTGFLFAYSYLAKQMRGDEKVSITVNDLQSKPYIDVTIDVLKNFNLPTPINKSYNQFVFHKPIAIKNNIQHTYYNIEGDWSGAAFLLVAGAIAGKVEVNNLNYNSLQADKAIIIALQQCGASVLVNDNSIIVQKPKFGLKNFTFNATHCPDLFPPLVALAACSKGVSKIIGIDRLIHKESNRALTLQSEFMKLGVNIQLEENSMLITGVNNIKGTTVNSHNDHRIAMACAIAALNANEKVVIENADAVKKSYPNFFIDLKKLGCKLKG